MTSQHHRSSLIFLVLFLFLGFYPVPIQASDCPYSIHVEAEPSSAKPGDEVRLSCSLAGYENPDSPDLMGVQVNINSITEEMKPSSLKSLIVSGQHLSNRASYNKKNQSVVLLYMSDRFADDESQIQYLSRSTTGLVEGIIQIPSMQTGQREIVLPVRVILIDKSNRTYTLNDSVVISANSDAPPAESLEITWEDMNFEWNKGNWNSNTLRYENQGWTGNGGLTITNRGQTAKTIQVTFTSLIDQISGSVVDETGSAIEHVSASSQQTRKISLQLFGKPDRALNGEKPGELNLRVEDTAPPE